MKIKLSKSDKLYLLTAVSKGELDTDKIDCLKGIAPARTLTTEEAAELWKKLESGEY